MTIPNRLRLVGLLPLGLLALACGSPAAPLPGVDLSSASAVPSSGTWFAYEAGGAGTVRFSVVGDRLRLDSVEPQEGWTWRPDQDNTDDDVALDFDHEGDSQKVDFEADLQSGVLLVEVETTFPADDRVLEWPADSAAEVHLSVSDQRVSVDSIAANEGWTWTQRDKDAVSIRFVNEEAVSVDFDARTDDGRLEVEVETRWRPALDDALELRKRVAGTASGQASSPGHSSA